MSWTFDEERVMHISGWMLLWLKQSVKIPEGTFDEVVGRHFGESATHTKVLVSLSCHDTERSAHPISKKICRYSVLTFIKG